MRFRGGIALLLFAAAGMGFLAGAALPPAFADPGYPHNRAECAGTEGCGSFCFWNLCTECTEGCACSDVTPNPLCPTSGPCDVPNVSPSGCAADCQSLNTTFIYSTPCDCPPCTAWYWHLYEVNDAGAPAPPVGYAPGYTGPVGNKTSNFGTPNIRQAIDLAITSPRDEVVCEGATSVGGGTPTPLPMPTSSPIPTTPATATPEWNTATPGWNTMHGVFPQGPFTYGGILATPSLPTPLAGYDSTPNPAFHGLENRGHSGTLILGNINATPPPGVLTDFEDFTPPTPPALLVPPIPVTANLRDRLRNSLTPPPASLIAVYRLKETYLGTPRGAPWLRGGGAIARLRILLFYDPRGLTSIEYRIWHYFGGEVPGDTVTVAPVPDDDRITVPGPGIWELQLRGVNPDGTYSPWSNSLIVLRGADDFTGASFAELEALTTGDDVINAPPTATLIPLPEGVVRQPPPAIVSVVQDMSVANFIRVDLTVDSSRPPGVLEYRYWRHTGVLATEGYAPWQEATSDTIEIDDIDLPTELTDCYDVGSLRVSTPTPTPTPTACPFSAPVLWDFQVRVRPDGSGTGDASDVVTLLVWDHRQ